MPYMDIDQIATPQRKKIILMDNNILAAVDYAKEQIHYVVSAMAMTGAQILMDEKLRKKIREEFDQAER